MLKQQNFQIPKIKKRKLYTPQSDDDENISENGICKEITNKNIDIKLSDKSIPVEATKSSEVTKKVSLVKIFNNVISHPDEIAESTVLRTLKPHFRKKCDMPTKSIWSVSFRFNPVEIANKTATRRKRSVKNNDDDNVNRIVDVSHRKPPENKMTESNKNEIIAPFISKKQRHQDEISHSSKYRLYSVSEIQQPHSTNDFSIKDVQSTINCGVLNSIFKQHEISESQRNQDVRQINNPIKDCFILSQFSNKKNSLNANSIDVECDCGNLKNVLFDSKKILNEWLRSSPQKKNGYRKEDEKEIFSNVSLMNEDTKKLRHCGSMFNCFK